jgi:hypothetical protein
MRTDVARLAHLALSKHDQYGAELEQGAENWEELEHMQAHAEGVAHVLSWLAGDDPAPPLTDLLELNP